jgi:hypothetical protein
MNFLWDLYQQGQINELRASSEATRAQENRQVSTEVKRLHDRIDTLTLTNLALWTLLREKLGMSDEELEARIRQLDLADGNLDGKVSATRVWNCEGCKRANSTRHLQCLYCGAEKKGGNPFPLR